MLMQGIYHGARLVSERAVQGLFGSAQGLIANWGPLHFGQGKSLNDHAAFKRFLDQSSLEGMDSTLLYRVDYRGVSEAWQPTTAREDDRAKAWKFEAVLDAVHHTDLVTRSRQNSLGILSPAYNPTHYELGTYKRFI